MKRKLTIAGVAAALLLVLIWWFFPRPLLREETGEVFHVERWETGWFVNVTNQVDTEGLMELMSGYRRRVRWFGSVVDLNKYPVGIYISHPGVTGSWIVAAGPDGAYAYNVHETLNWKILDGKNLWQEIKPLLPTDK